MRTYDFLSKVAPARKKYAFKFFLIALPVILFPLGELAIFAMMAKGVITASLQTVVIFVSILTVLSAVILLFLYNQLLTPLHMAKQALNNYVTSNEMPTLPMEYDDEAGVLMGDIQATITQLDTLLTEKSDMIDLLSHDLRSPVGRIISLSNLIKTDEDTDKNIYADYIVNECRGLLRVLENILMMLKEENHAVSLTNVNLKQLMQETVGFFDFAIADKNLNMEVDIDESLHVVVQQELFTQAVRNIIGNAIKFSSPGMAISITVKHDDSHIALSIHDEGLGFLPADQERIFDRFTRAGKKGTHGEKSMGLGMYLSKKIVEKHGGTLVAKSDGINKGATFTITLNRLVIKKRQGKSNAGKIVSPRKTLVA
jgi:signal transduction histidine kinase